MDVREKGSCQRNSSKLQILSIMTVPPLKVTEPKQLCHVLVSDTIHPSSTIDGCYQIVLYYEKVTEEVGHGWSLAGWIVESLATVLSDHPLLAGRLQRKNVANDTRLEIVSNDCGVRLLDASYPMSLSEFIELNEKENQHLEAELVSWKKIDDQHPEFCPLFYVQVTNFECGGYSIGISCSILLAEVFVVDNFLNKWSQIHNMLAKNQDNVTPVFCQTRKKNDGLLSSNITGCTQSKQEIQIQSVVFKITLDDVEFSNEKWKELATLCLEEAEQKLEKKISSYFSLVVKESKEVIKVESCSKIGYNKQGLDLKNQILCVKWKDFGMNEVAFHKGNKPVHVSCWIGYVANECVLAMPCPKGNACALIVVSPLLKHNSM